MAFYAMDPWGEYRADLRMARNIAFQCKSPPALEELVLFPDARNELPDDVTPDEQAWMLKLNRQAE